MSDQPPLPFPLNTGACVERDIRVFDRGSIQGRVLNSSNQLVPDVSLYILPAEEKAPSSRSELYWESQRKNGFFKFVHLPPGRYLLLLHPDDTVNPGISRRRTFYPGVGDRQSAGIVTIRAGEEIKDVDIRLQRRPQP